VTEVVPHSEDGYGWSMDDSARLRAEIERRAAKRAATPRAPINQVVSDLARKRGVDPQLLDMSNPANRTRADQLLADKEAQLHRERIERQAGILLSRLPVIYRNATLPHTEWARGAVEWLRDFRAARKSGAVPPGLTIMGPKGSGKTWTSAALARILLLEDTIPVTFTTVQEMIDAVKPTSGHGLDVDMIQFELAPILVLDDFGAERRTDFAMDQLMRLSNARSGNGRPTIITTNLLGEQIWSLYDDRIVDRLFGGHKLLVVNTSSRRSVPFAPKERP
jgi:DNA replication protein DnaC